MEHRGGQGLGGTGMVSAAGMGRADIPAEGAARQHRSRQCWEWALQGFPVRERALERGQRAVGRQAWWDQQLPPHPPSPPR